MKTGVIGLGAMGANMARNLARENHLVAVYNRTHSKASKLATEYSVTAYPTAGELAARCELIIICVSRDEDMLEMIEAIQPGIEPGTIVVDTSTVSTETVRTAAAELTNQQSYFLDCPVSGGVEGAKHGTLAMMVGGDETILDKARPTLDAIADNIVYIGASGSGQATKAVNQIMAAGINQAVTEALSFGDTMDLPMEKVIDIVATGAAGNWFLDHRGKTMLAGIYDPGFKLQLHHKDLSICQSMARALGENRLPLVEMTLIHYQQLMDRGFGDEDISALFRLKKSRLDRPKSQ